MKLFLEKGTLSSNKLEGFSDQPRANVIKLFTVVSYDFSYLARTFVPGKPYHPSLMFVGKAGAYPSEAPSVSGVAS